MRIVSFLPSGTEIVCLLGLRNNLLGVTHECDFPPEVRKKPAVIRSRINRGLKENEIDEKVQAELQAGRSLYTIDLELLRELRPDLLVTQELCNVCAVTYSDVLRAATLLRPRPRVFSLNPRRLEDVFQDILDLGEVTGTGGVAKARVSCLRERVQAVSEKAGSRDSRPRVACLEWLDPLMVAGHWVPEMVEFAGGIDILGEEGKPSFRVDWESVLKSKPDLLFLMPCGLKIAETVRDVQTLRRFSGWKEIPAVRNGQVYAVDGPSYFNRSGPRLVDGIELMASLMRPGELSSERFQGAFLRIRDC